MNIYIYKYIYTFIFIFISLKGIYDFRPLQTGPAQAASHHDSLWPPLFTFHFSSPGVERQARSGGGTEADGDGSATEVGETVGQGRATWSLGVTDVTGRI
jgi:hypothetical protein